MHTAHCTPTTYTAETKHFLGILALFFLQRFRFVFVDSQIAKSRPAAPQRFLSLDFSVGPLLSPVLSPPS